MQTNKAFTETPQGEKDGDIKNLIQYCEIQNVEIIRMNKEIDEQKSDITDLIKYIQELTNNTPGGSNTPEDYQKDIADLIDYIQSMHQTPDAIGANGEINTDTGDKEELQRKQTELRTLVLSSEG